MTPVLNTATPIMSNSELTTKAKLNWILESQVEKRTARAMSLSSLWSILRLCEIEEWR